MIEASNEFDFGRVTSFAEPSPVSRSAHKGNPAPRFRSTEEKMRMNGVNQVFLMGYLGSTPELQTSKRGKPYARLSLATHHRTRNDEGETQSMTQWHRVMVWGRNAELCSTYLQKGSPLAIEGALSHYKSERDDGTEVTQTSVTAHRIHFVGPRANQAPTAFDEPTP
jgi:single-strand DNA-binding protein